MDIDRESIAIRLTEERARKGYSQADFARQLDVTREGLRLYEMGQRGVSAEFLAKAAGLGIDVQYVLTGIKSNNAAEAEKNASPEPSSAVSISGGNFAGFVGTAQTGSTVHMINTPRYVTNTKAEVKPGEDHISEEQAAKLTTLVSDIVELEQRVRKAPKSFRGVWASLNAHCGVTRYRLIPAKDFAKAEKYLYTWIGRLNSSSKAATSDNDTWRKRRFAYIKINTKDDEEWLAAYLRKTFKVSSIKELDDASLDRTYRAVASRKRRV
ncbi:helix-turn-helix domain-containing protein [Pseudomonas aeruginosa]|uniref:transcriptional regulator n=1 Tax=Pseudomonas aeruginosa TaxID=287 RepID=UPI0003BB0BEC|nr:transcriptional regulator [Pseudomonas aeruginosa]AKE69864.1 hypothetical protein YQ19_17095 [Pseudomonas aeruginosa]AKG02029.1 hypothetical protein YH69_29670 [Pseudomonas aeruginosa]ARG51121.1 hypothetical protein BFV99_17835 [Pseudomonas aeruginosa]EIU2639534.1 ORF6C domain-containing protein [Pseudomonas aeruginosa]EIU4984437.1 helix-turn-helix domain-containing protein [Pseudomonas aeruginosa]